MIAWVVEAVIASTMLMLAVMALRGPVARHFGAQAAYALWALPALRMVLPPLGALFGGAAPMASVRPVSGTISDIVYDSVLTGGAAGMDSAPQMASAMSGGGQGWIALAVLLWLGGAGLFLAGHVWGYRQFRRHMLTDAQALGDAAPGIGLIASPRANGPMAFGLLRKIIVFPVDATDRFDHDEHALALAHELAHHRRGDLIANAFALAVAALHWWNPVAWIAYRMFRADQEVACDAQVVTEARRRGLGQVYGRALIKAATSREYAIACHLTSVETLKRRLTMLAQAAPSRRRRAFGLMLIGGTTLGGLALTASGEGVAADMGSRVAAALPVAGSVVGLAAPAAVSSPAPVVPAVPGALVAADAPSAPNAPDVPPVTDAPRHLAAPAWPEPPVPPTPPVPPVRAAGTSMETVEMRRAMREADQAAREADQARAEAMREAEQARREALRDAEQTRREALLDGAQARREAMRAAAADRAAALRDAEAARAEAIRAKTMASVPQVSVTRSCPAGQNEPTRQISRVDENGRTRISISVCGEAIARQARQQAINGLTEARLSLANNAALSNDVRARVSRDLDREIARLRSERD